MSTYLITGIAGFIGSSLARAVLQRGHRVRGIDNFSTGKPENIVEIIDQIDFREADLLDLEATQEACRDVDYVLHEAALPSVPRSINRPLETNRANVDGTLNLLIAARDAKVGRVIYAASSSAYGDAPTLPKREDMAAQDRIAESSHYVDRVASGSQWLYAPGSWISGRSTQQERRGNPHLPPAGCQLSVVCSRSLPALGKLHQCHCVGQTEASAVFGQRCRDYPLHKRHRYLELGQQ